MNYLTLITNKHFKAIVINIKNTDHEQINHAYALADRMECVGVLSNYKDIFNANFKRNKVTGEILLSDIPQRLDNEALLAYLDKLAVKLREKNYKRTVHPNSLANLSQSNWFTSTRRPNKPRKVMDEQIRKAKQLKQQGLSWKTVGDRLGLNASSIRSAIIRYDSKIALSAPPSSYSHHTKAANIVDQPIQPTHNPQDLPLQIG